jgi:aromatic ring hydroxylase
MHDTDLAVMFIAPMNACGVKLICRTSYDNLRFSATIRVEKMRQ